MKIVIALLVVATTIWRWTSRLRVAYEREVKTRLSASSPAAHDALLTVGDLQHLPDAIQRYIRLSGALGQPKVHNLHARFRGRIRGGPDEPWMPFEGEQYNFSTRRRDCST